MNALSDPWRSWLLGIFSRPGKMMGSVGQPRLSSNSISSLSAGLMARRFLAKIPYIEAWSISILRKSFSPSLVPEMSSPVPVTIFSLTPGGGAVLFRMEEGEEGCVAPPIPVTPTAETKKEFY